MSSEQDPLSRGAVQPTTASRTARKPLWPFLLLALVVGIGLGLFLPERPGEHRTSAPKAQVEVPRPAETPPVVQRAPTPEPLPEVPVVPDASTSSVPPSSDASPSTGLPQPPDSSIAPERAAPPASSAPSPADPADVAPQATERAPDAIAPSSPPEIPAPPNLEAKTPEPAPVPSEPPASPPQAEAQPDAPPPAETRPATPPLTAKPPAGGRSSEQAHRPPTSPPSSSEPPAWRRYAVAAPAVAGRPMVAVIIDDMGLDARRSRLMMELPGPLTTSFIPYAKDLARQTAAARGFGHELMLHVSMQPLNAAIDPGPNALMVDQDAAEIRRRLTWAFDSFSGYVGINNHMGSRFTTDRPGMSVVMQELKARGLLFLDSRTVPHSLGIPLAGEFRVPHAGRSLFIDNVQTVDAVMKELAEIEQIARRAQVAIAIGHPYDATLAALREWLPTLASKEIALVPVSTIVARQEARRAGAEAKPSASPR